MEVEVTQIESIQPLLENAAKATRSAKMLSDERKSEILKALSVKILENVKQIVAENQKDLIQMSDTDPKKDRLRLTEPRIQDLADSLVEIAQLSDPTNQVVLERTMPNGLFIQ